MIRASTVKRRQKLTFEGVLGLATDSPSLDAANVSEAGGTKPFVGCGVLGAAEAGGIGEDCGTGKDTGVGIAFAWILYLTTVETMNKRNPPTKNVNPADFWLCDPLQSSRINSAFSHLLSSHWQSEK